MDKKTANSQLLDLRWNWGLTGKENQRSCNFFPATNLQSYKVYYSVADPGFPRGGGANSPGGAPTYDFAKISPKLHKIERIWTPGGRLKFYYGDPPLLFMQYFSSKALPRWEGCLFWDFTQCLILPQGLGQQQTIWYAIYSVMYPTSQMRLTHQFLFEFSHNTQSWQYW